MLAPVYLTMGGNGGCGGMGRGESLKDFWWGRDPVEQRERITMQIGRLSTIAEIDSQYLDSSIEIVNYVTLFFSNHTI